MHEVHWNLKQPAFEKLKRQPKMKAILPSVCSERIRLEFHGQILLGLSKTKNDTVTIKQETCAWIQMVVDAAVKLVAFNDVTAALLSQAWRQVSREFFAECRGKFWSVRSRSLGSCKQSNQEIERHILIFQVPLRTSCLADKARCISCKRSTNKQLTVKAIYYAETCQIRRLPDWGLICTPAVASVHVLTIQAQLK